MVSSLPTMLGSLPGRHTPHRRCAGDQWKVPKDTLENTKRTNVNRDEKWVKLFVAYFISLQFIHDEINKVRESYSCPPGKPPLFGPAAQEAEERAEEGGALLVVAVAVAVAVFRSELAEVG